MRKMVYVDKLCEEINRRMINKPYKELTVQQVAYMWGLNEVLNIIDEMEQVDAIPCSWLYKQAENPNNSDAFRNFIDKLVYDMWKNKENKDETY